MRGAFFDPTPSPMSPEKKTARFAWGVLAYNLLVIVWGAYVRASGSGAGCGKHWPLCNGEVVPQAPKLKTLIEFSHRLTSGFSLVLVIALCVAVFRSVKKGAPARRAAVASVVFILSEALIGAGLVLFELVAHNASMKRALSMSLHLTNTFLLLASLTLTAWWSSGAPAIRMKNGGPARIFLLASFGLMFILGTSGAIAALGDTLFPSQSLADGLRADLSPAASLLLRLRVLHPVIALATATVVVGTASVSRAMFRSVARVRRWASLTVLIVLAQIGAGFLNVLLLAPTWMQLVHLILADLVWISVVLLAASVMAEEAPPVESEASAAHHV